MSFIKKLCFNCLLILIIAHSSLFGCEQFGYNEGHEILHEFCDGRIRVKTITDYESVLDTIFEEKQKDSSQTFFHLSDWDCVVVGISNFDHANFHRQGNTAFVVKKIKEMGIPMAVVTARWLTSTLEDYEPYAQSMESGTGICVSDQQAFNGLKLDLRQGSLKRGICIGGICFTGSSKGPVTSVLIDHPSLPKASHYLYVDDDPEYIRQMIEAFRERTEKITIHYYPNEVTKQKHESVLHHLSSLQPLRCLSFLMRHNYEEKVRQLLSNTAVVEEIQKANPHPLLVDLLHSDSEGLLDHAVRILGFEVAKLGHQEIMGLLQHTYEHGKTTSTKWLMKNSSQDALFSVSLWMIFDSYSHPIIKEFFDSTPHKDSLIVNIFSLPKMEPLNGLSAIDPFMTILEAQVVHKGVLPRLEERLQYLAEDTIYTQRLAAAKKMLT